MKKFFVPFILLIVLALVTSAYAQRGGRGDRTPEPEGTRALPTRDHNATPRAIPTDWSSISIPTSFPSREELQARIEELELPFDLESLDLPESSPEAYSALVAFGQSYLGIYIDPLYAGTLDAALASQEIPTEISSISTELPSEIQTILSSASGLSYYGIFETGAATVYTASECTATNCSVTMDNLQLTLTSGSLGIYSLYAEGTVSDAASAQNLIFASYPALSAYTLTDASTESGYAFTATAYTDGQVAGFVAGVLTADNGKSLIYVAYGLGEVYVSILR